MKKIEHIVLFINYAMITLTLLCVLFIGFCEVFGYNVGEKLLNKFNLEVNQIVFLCFIFGIIMIFSKILQNKFFK